MKKKNGLKRKVDPWSQGFSFTQQYEEKVWRERKNGLKRRLRSLATRAFHLLSSMKRERLEQKVVLKQGCRLLPVEACISGPPVHCTALYVNASRCKCECTHIQLVLPVCPDKVQEVLDGLPISPKSAPQPRRCCRLLQTAPGDKQQDYEDQLRIDRDREMNKQHSQLSLMHRQEKTAQADGKNCMLP